MEVGTRRIVQRNDTSHPTADCTLLQFRKVVSGEKQYRFLIHDRDNSYSPPLDSALAAMGLRILKTPSRAPQANAYCKRLVDSVRRQCLDFSIPLSEKHLRRTRKLWVEHYNKDRPHSSLGPGIPDPARDLPQAASSYCVPKGYCVIAKPVLNGLHHEYPLERCAA